MKGVFVSSLLRLFFVLVFLVQVPLGQAEKTLTIASPSGEKAITLDEDPEVLISYTPSGMKLTFTNLNMKVVCIEDPSTSGLCRLQAYDGGEVISGSSESVPGAPGIPTATAGNTQVQLSWTAPARDGGSTITGYLIEKAVSSSSPSFQTAVANTSSAATEHTVTGLTNETAYVFRVAAINAIGTGARGGYSSAVTPTAPAVVGSGAYATACSGVPAIVDCRKLFEGDLSVGGSGRSVGIANDTVLSIPFIRETGTVPVRIGYQSFESSTGYFFDAWISETANGLPLPGVNCSISQPAAESILTLNSQSGQGGGCNTLSGEGLVWLNFKFWNPNTEDYARYTIATLTVTPDP